MLVRMIVLFLLLEPGWLWNSRPSFQVMVNPDTGEAKVVSHHSWGMAWRELLPPSGPNRLRNPTLNP